MGSLAGLSLTAGQTGRKEIVTGKKTQMGKLCNFFLPKFPPTAHFNAFRRYWPLQSENPITIHYHKATGQELEWGGGLGPAGWSKMRPMLLEMSGGAGYK